MVKMFKTAALINLFALLGAAVAQDSQCHDYVLVSIRGTYEVQGPSIGFPGMINMTLNTIPGGIEYDAVYPAAPNQTAYLGAEDVVRYIDAGLQNCPDQKYAILGYSQGASATAIALKNYTDTASAGYEAIRAVVVIGNPYHISGRMANVDQNGTDATRDYNGASLGNNTNAGIPEVFYTNEKLLDICYTGDVVCCPGYPGANFVPNHLMYGGDENVQKMGADFIIKGLNANGTNGMNGTTTSSPAMPQPTNAASSVASNTFLVVAMAAVIAMAGLTV